MLARSSGDAFAVRSHQRAAQAWAEGRFKNSVIPVTDVNGLVKRLIDVRKCSFLPTDRAVEGSGMEHGEPLHGGAEPDGAQFFKPSGTY